MTLKSSDFPGFFFYEFYSRLNDRFQNGQRFTQNKIKQDADDSFFQ